MTHIEVHKESIMSATVNTPVIRLENVTKRFGREVALDGVSFEVPRGVVFALLGENGAGKTTAIRALLGLGHPDAGKLEVLGLDSRRDGLKIRERAGCMFEKPTLYEWMTVDEIGWYTAGFYGDGFLERYRIMAAQRACGKLGVWGQTASCLRAASVSGRLVSRLSMTSIMLT